MTLTHKLDLDILPLDLHAKIQVCMSVCSDVIVRRTHTQTHTRHQNYYTHHVRDLTWGVIICYVSVLQFGCPPRMPHTANFLLCTFKLSVQLSVTALTAEQFEYVRCLLQLVSAEQWGSCLFIAWFLLPVWFGSLFTKLSYFTGRGAVCL